MLSSESLTAPLIAWTKLQMTRRTHLQLCVLNLSDLAMVWTIGILIWKVRCLVDALHYGAEIITAYEVHEKGMDSVIDRTPANGRYYLTIDADGFDPAVMPAVAAPVAGGLLFHQVRRLIHGLVGKGRLLGMDIVEITPERDLNGISSLTAGQLIINFIGTSASAGYFS